MYSKGKLSMRNDKNHNGLQRSCFGDSYSIIPLMYYAVTDFSIAVNKINTTYMWLSTNEMTIFKNKVKEIHVILGNEKHIVLKGTVLEVGASASDFEIYLGIQNWVLTF